MASILLTWRDNSTTEEGQRVYRSSEPMDVNDLPPPLAELPPDVTTYTDADVIEGALYYYRVSAYMGEFQLVSSEVAIVAGNEEEFDPHWDKVVSLLHFDGSFNDETGLSWTVAGNAVIAPNSGIQGTGCYSGDGINGYIRASSPVLVLGGEDFTIEGFTHMLGSTHLGSSFSNCLVDMRKASSDANILLDIYDDGTLRLYLNGSYLIDNSSAVKLRVGLTHWALERHGNNLLLFVDGVLAGSRAFSGSFNSDTLTLGGRYIILSGDFRSVNGLIDEFRITKGVARYTENFTPPTKPFPNFGPPAPALP